MLTDVLLVEKTTVYTNVYNHNMMYFIKIYWKKKYYKLIIISRVFDK